MCHIPYGIETTFPSLTRLALATESGPVLSSLGLFFLEKYSTYYLKRRRTKGSERLVGKE